MQIKKETIDFLKLLEKNNNRDWFNENKKLYLSAHENILSFLDNLIPKLAKLDPALSDLEPKKALFRIYRDTRFAKDKTPYKTNFGARMHGGGKDPESTLAGFYLNIKPGDCFIGGGLYHPGPKRLKEVRDEISFNAEEFHKILEDKKFKSQFTLWGEKLKRPPKGFDAEDPMIEYIKYKDIVVMHKFDESEIYKEGFLDYCLQKCKQIMPINNFLNAPIREPV